MTSDDDRPVQVQVVPPKGPIPAMAEPWVNLIHQIGMPWALLIGLCYFFYPIANKSLETLNRLDNHANTAMPLLQKAAEAVPLLEELNRGQARATNQRHSDAIDLKATVESKDSN